MQVFLWNRISLMHLSAQLTTTETSMPVRSNIIFRALLPLNRPVSSTLTGTYSQAVCMSRGLETAESVKLISSSATAQQFPHLLQLPSLPPITAPRTMQALTLLLTLLHGSISARKALTAFQVRLSARFTRMRLSP